MSASQLCRSNGSRAHLLGGSAQLPSKGQGPCGCYCRAATAARGSYRDSGLGRLSCATARVTGVIGRPPPFGGLAPGDLVRLAMFSLDLAAFAEILGVKGVHSVSARIGVYCYEVAQVAAAH